MQDPNSIISQAMDGHFREIADELCISDKRLYRVIADHDPYAKLWRYLNPLGRIAPDRLALVRADFNARCDRILDGRTTPSTLETLNKELHEAENAVIRKAPLPERRKEILEAIAELEKELEKCDDGNIRRFAS